ncbi:MAG: CCA tRNA nucleotidyltransferase [Oscillospiraceae bacterium]|nr:CCA tRNA nucleotidyltransferase [Oscillospiraceae bacterium]
MYTMILPSAVQAAIERLQQHGFEAYIVGGCVRDALLHTTAQDWDLTTNAHPEQILQCFHDFHVIETGMQHGTVTVIIDAMPLEITTYRVDGAYTDHRRPDSVQFTTSLTEDLARRDFSINAMAYHPQKGLIDPFGGQQDLAAKTISCVGDPTQRFQEDGLRILRALRFASRLDFSIAEETAKAIHQQKDLLHHISAERIFSELTKLLCGNAASKQLLQYPDVLFTVLPTLQPMYQFDQKNPYHAYDVYTHTCMVIENVPPQPALRWAALLHDSGKPHTFTMDARGGHFYNHAEHSVVIAKEILMQLKSDRKTMDRVLTLVKHHDTVFSGSETQMKRLAHRLGTDGLRDLILLHRGDVSAQAEHLRQERLAQSDMLLTLLDELERKNTCLTFRDLHISGDDLIAMGMQPGVALGNCLRRLLDAVLDNQLSNDKAALMEAAAQYLNNNPQ